VIEKYIFSGEIVYLPTVLGITGWGEIIYPGKLTFFKRN